MYAPGTGMPNELRERDMMHCRYCGNPDRASEGSTCKSCGTFICIVCSFRGVTLCRKCETETGIKQPSTAT